MPYELMSILEVLDPMVLGSKVKEVCDCGECACCQIPGDIRGIFDEDLVLGGDKRRLYVTLGQFSMIRLERDVQLVVPVIDYSVPTKACCEGAPCTEDPCEMFSRIPFPTQQFNPQQCDKADCGPCPCYQTT